MDDDKKQNDASLRGRGRDLMRGPSDEASQDDAAPKNNAGSWLPPAEEAADDEAAHFETEDDVLRFLDADPEAYRPTTIPDRSLLSKFDEPSPAPGLPNDPESVDIFAEPDFDTIFGVQDASTEDFTAERDIPADHPDVAPQDEVPRPPTADMPTAEAASGAKTLDDIFSQDDPNFDDLFGELVDDEEQTAALSTRGNLAPDQTSIDELTSIPLPETGELFADELYEEDSVPGFVDQRAEAPSSAPRGLEEIQHDWRDDDDSETLIIPSRDIEDSTYNEAPTPDQNATVMVDRNSESPTWDADTPGEATSILNETFDETDEEASTPANQSALDLLAEMSQEMVDEPETTAETSQPKPPGVASALSKPMELPSLEEEPVLQDDLAPEDELFVPEVEEFEPARERASEAVSFDLLGADEDEPQTRTALAQREEDEPDFDLASVPTAPPSNMQAKPLARVQPDKPEPQNDREPSEAERFIAMLEDEDQEQRKPAMPTPSFAAAAESPEDEDEATIPLPTSRAMDTQPSASTAPVQTDAVQPAAEDREPFGARDDVGAWGQAARGEAIPRPEDDEAELVDLRDRALRRGALADLTPPEPETFSPGEQPFEVYDEDLDEDAYDPARFQAALEAAQEREVGGGTAEDDELVSRSGLVPIAGLAQDAPLPEPFGGPMEERRPAGELFRPSQYEPDPEMLQRFIDDNRLRDLFERIEALQEDIIENVRGDRGLTDIYQEELLQAHNMLLSSRANYDEARAIVNRVRADLKREQRVRDAIQEYRPLIINIYLGMAIFIVVMALLGQLFIDIPEELGVAWLGHGYYPALAGMVGALLFGYRTLNKHTTAQMDFDPSHIHWYWLYPLGGLISGFLLYMLLLSTGMTTLNTVNAETTGTSPVTLFLAGAVGYNQNLVRNILESARDRIAPDSDVPTRRN